MDYRHLCSVPPRCRALRSVLDFCPFCRRDHPRIYHWIVVYFTSHSSKRSSVADPAFGSRVNGVTYADVLHIYGISRAGYVPQMSTFYLPNPIVIYELLQKAGARALVCEPSFGVDLSGCPVLTYPAIRVPEQYVTDVILPPPRTDYSASDLVLILHTSGSTGGSPKLVPCNRRWIDNIVVKAKQMAQVRSNRGQDVSVAV